MTIVPNVAVAGAPAGGLAEYCSRLVAGHARLLSDKHKQGDGTLSTSRFMHATLPLFHVKPS